ncbi:MAG TPA: hypothetical protein VGE01_10795, partial [Fimbriimonas sp.]
GGPRQTAPNATDGQGRTIYVFAQPSYSNHRDVRPVEKRRYRARAGFWPLEGLRILSTQPYSLAVETPFLMVFWRNLTLMPGDFGVVEANGWIVLVHLPTGRLTTLARGKNPTVVLDEPNAAEAYVR